MESETGRKAMAEERQKREREKRPGFLRRDAHEAMRQHAKGSFTLPGLTRAAPCPIAAAPALHRRRCNVGFSILLIINGIFKLG